MGCVKLNRTKAWAIKTNQEDGFNKYLTSKRNPKTHNFQANIEYPLKRDSVTIDAWAINAASKLDGPRKGLPNLAACSRYDKLAAAYRDAAAILGYEIVNQLQAVVWIQIRKELVGKPQPVKE
jgi:hypothetical protein